MDEVLWQQRVFSMSLSVHGWPKRCLYTALVLLLCLTTLNLSLFIWIIKVLSIDNNGIMYLQTTGGAIELSQKTFIMDTLVTTGLHTRNVGSIRSSLTLTLGTTGHEGFVASIIRMDSGVIEVNTPSFKVTDPRGKTLFSVNKETVSLAASTLSLSGEGGVAVQGSLQTTVVSAGIRSDLMLESVSKELLASTSNAVTIESRAGGIMASSLHDISLNTVEGSIKLESSNILMPSLHYPERSHRQHKHHHHPERIYQLCVCSNGDLFLAQAEGTCDTMDVCSSL